MFVTLTCQHNGCNPDRIIIFRDGVSDGDLEYVDKYEVKQLLLTFDRIAPNYKPQLSVVIVQKRINTRLFIARVSIGLARKSIPLRSPLLKSKS